MRSLLLPAALVSACAAIHTSARVPPVQVEDGLRLGGGRLDGNSSKRKTMAVKGHTVQEVSSSWTGKVVYASVTCAIPKYHEALLAQVETWAARPAAEGRYVAVGSNNYPDEWAGKSVLKSECGDDMKSISCKEATLLAEGAARGADWLLVSGEDNYVHTEHVERALSDKDPNVAVAYGVIGCGKGEYCTEQEAFNARGGFCGGSTYIISRAGLQKLLADGAPALHAVYDKTPWPNDMTTSCQLQRTGTDLAWMDNMIGYPIFEIAEYEGVVRDGTFLVTHYVDPATMRWFHALNEGAEASVLKPLEEEASDHGCVRSMRKREPDTFNKCLQKKGVLAEPEKNGVLAEPEKKGVFVEPHLTRKQRAVNENKRRKKTNWENEKKMRAVSE